MLLSDPIPRPERARGDCGRKKLPFNRKKPPSEPEPGRAAICLDQLGVEGTTNKQRPLDSWGMEQKTGKYWFGLVSSQE